MPQEHCSGRKSRLCWRQTSSDKLLKGQRAWVQYKEAFTDLVQLPNEGGSMARLNSMSFLTGETRKQALLLGQIAGE